MLCIEKMINVINKKTIRKIENKCILDKVVIINNMDLIIRILLSKSKKIIILIIIKILNEDSFKSFVIKLIMINYFYYFYW